MPNETSKRYAGPERRKRPRDRRAHEPASVRLAVRSMAVIFGGMTMSLFVMVAVVAIVGQHGLALNRQATKCNLERQAEQGIRGRIQSLELGKAQGTIVSLPPELEPDVIPRDLVESCKTFLSGKRVDPAELQRELPGGPIAALPPAVTGPTSTTSTSVKRAAPKKAPAKKPPAKTTSTRPVPPRTSPPTTSSTTTTTAPCTVPQLPAICGGLPVNE